MNVSYTGELWGRGTLGIWEGGGWVYWESKSVGGVPWGLVQEDERGTQDLWGWGALAIVAGGGGMD